MDQEQERSKFFYLRNKRGKLSRLEFEERMGGESFNVTTEAEMNGGHEVSFCKLMRLNRSKLAIDHCKFKKIFLINAFFAAKFRI